MLLTTTVVYAIVVTATFPTAYAEAVAEFPPEKGLVAVSSGFQWDHYTPRQHFRFLVKRAAIRALLGPIYWAYLALTGRYAGYVWPNRNDFLERSPKS